ncbi:hypothetical protein ACFVUY_36490 [Kitasatospora sp. NPDC058063]|uniref:hypothetical protein n=1 Tax=unclassified Kitasatospora TaxID=2633591 RepID=UPI0036D958E5
MDLDEHLRYENDSLGRYPRTADGTVEWGSVSHELVIGSSASGTIDLSSTIENCAPNADSIVFMWGSLAVPSVKMDPAAVSSHAADILESMPEFWAYSPADRVLLEHTFSGLVTTAHVPTGRTA